MIQTLDKSFEEVRSVLVNDINEVSVCRSLSSTDSNYYTVIILKERQVQTRILNIFSQYSYTSLSNDFEKLSAIDSELMMVFCYKKENSLFYYLNLYCRNFSDRLKVARNLLAELMSSSLPLEVQYFILDEHNLNLTSDGQVYFNYYMNFKILPEKLMLQDVVNKAAETILKILTCGFKVSSPEIDLFRFKVLRKSFSSFSAIYSDLKIISPDVEVGSDLAKRMRLLYSKSKPRAVFVLKAGLLAVIIAASIFYGITEWNSRSAAAATQNISDAPPEYKGLEKIGTISLAEEGASDTGKTTADK